MGSKPGHQPKTGKPALSNCRRIGLEIRQLSRYSLVGIINTAVTAGIIWVSEKLGVAYPVYTSYAYILGMALSYTSHRFITFRSDAGNRLRSLGKFAAVGVLLLALIQILQFLLIEILGVNKTIGLVVAMAIYTGLGYAANRIWIFTVKQKHETN